MTKNYDTLTPVGYGDSPQFVRKTIGEGVAFTWNSPVRLALYLGRILYRWQARIVSRQDLKHLSEATLIDSGLSRKQVEKEVTKRFWQE